MARGEGDGGGREEEGRRRQQRRRGKGEVGRNKGRGTRARGGTATGRRTHAHADRRARAATCLAAADDRFAGVRGAYSSLLPTAARRSDANSRSRSEFRCRSVAASSRLCWRAVRISSRARSPCTRPFAIDSCCDRKLCEARRGARHARRGGSRHVRLTEQPAARRAEREAGGTSSTAAVARAAVGGLCDGAHIASHARPRAAHTPPRCTHLRHPACVAALRLELGE